MEKGQDGRLVGGSHSVDQGLSQWQTALCRSGAESMETAFCRSGVESMETAFCRSGVESMADSIL